MTLALDRQGSALATARTPIALAVADANWFTTENLFREAPPERASTLLLHCLDYLNAWRQGRRPWGHWADRLQRTGAATWRRELVLPSGWMKRYPSLGMRPIAGTIRRWHDRHMPDSPLGLVMTYPYYLHLRDLVRPDRQVYFNVDDYALYWPSVAEQVRALELRAVREADLTVCVARLRADALKAAVPEAAAKIIHLPHGAPADSIAPDPFDQPAPAPDDIAGLPRPFLGYVGSLEDRVDWPLLTRLAEAFPKASVVLVGRMDAAERPDRARCLALPNVHALGWRPQGSIHAYNRAFDVCLIPYQVDHPFNLACCPTKIMDTMGSGRPMASTALPECRLYTHLFHVAESPEAFIEAVRSIVESGSDDGRALLRWEWAMENTCAAVAGRLLDFLAG